MDFKKFLKDLLAININKVFGLDIGDRSIEIIEFNTFKSKVVAYGRIELTPGVVENGKILDQATLAEKLKKLLREAKPKNVSTNKVVVSLPESQVFVHCFEVDFNLKSNALSSAITEKVSLIMPINISKTYWYAIEKPLPDKTKKLIMFVSIPKDIANSYVKFCNSIGLEVMSLNVKSFGVAKVILKSSLKQSLIIDIGSKETDLSFFDSNDKINLSVAIATAGDNITQAIKDNLKVEITEAEALKAKFGLIEVPENIVRPIILPIIEVIIKETQGAIDYYETIFKQKLDDIFLIGGTALLPGITEAIKSGLKREVQIGVSNYDFNLSALTDKEHFFPLFANVIGLGMFGASREFKDMNLVRKIDSFEVNTVNKFDLFKVGYLSRIDALRAIFNNKLIISIVAIIFGVIFTIMGLKIKELYFTKIPLPPVIVTPVTYTPKPVIEISTSTIATSTVATSTNQTSVSTSSTNSKNYVISDGYVFNADQNPGTYSESVANLQNRLIKEGYFNGIAGGFFGPATEQALKVYQKAKGINETGILDANTRLKLNAK